MQYIDWLLSLLVLVVLEIVLGIDNLVLLSILTQRLPAQVRQRARRLGLTFAWMTRLLLLASAVVIVHFTTPLFFFWGRSFSVRELFFILGGGFLLFKSTQEIHREVESQEETPTDILKPKTQFLIIVLQIALLDIVFSLDSVLTAVGLTSQFWVMASAITVAVMVMLFASEIVCRFIETHPTIKMLALSFLILIGVMLVAEGFSFHMPRPYVYSAMLFSLGVESLNILKRKRSRRAVR